MKTLNFLLLAQLARAIQPSAPPARPTQLRELTWGKLNFLHTTDTHGWEAGHLQEPQYSADWGDYVSFVSRMRDLADKKGVDLVVVDTGDRIEGGGFSDGSEPKGKYVREVFKKLPADVVTLGNHELYKKESSDNEFFDMLPHYDGRYVVSNVDIYSPITGELVPLGNRSLTFTTPNQGVRIKTFGFLFDFLRNWNNTIVHPVEKVVLEEWFQKEIRDPNVDMFLIIGHTPVRDSPEYPSILNEIRKIRPNIAVQFFGGHTHIRDYAIYDKLSTGLESGRYCETVGFLSISHLPSEAQPEFPTYSRRYIDFNRFGFQHHAQVSKSTFDTEEGLWISNYIRQVRTTLGLDKLYGCAPKNYYIFRVPYPHPDSLYTLLSDDLLPKMVVNEERRNVPRLLFINSGSQRFDIFKGPFTYDTSFIISPFTSVFNVIKDVNYQIAKKLVILFNEDNRQWMYGSLEAHYHFKKMRALSTVEWANIEQRGGGQHPLVNNKNMRNPLAADEVPDFEQLQPGYITHDDAGIDGDDTPHDQLRYFKAPNAIVANASFSADPGAEEPETVDVVFLDFIQPFVLAGLHVLGAEYLDKDVEKYMARDETLTKLMLEYAQRYWAKEC